MSNLTKNDMNKISMWLKFIPNLTLAGIPQHHEEIFNAINNYYTSLNTLKSHYAVLAKVMKPFDEEVYQKYSKLSTEYNKKASQESTKQKMLQYALNLLKKE